MNRNLVFIIVLLASVLLAGLDFWLNGYGATLHYKADVTPTTHVTEEKSEPNPYSVKLLSTDTQLKLKNEKVTHTLFNKVDTSQTDFITSTTELLFSKNNINYFTLFSFKFSNRQPKVNYLNLKNIFKTLSEEHSNLSINETNTFGISSFYINNTQDADKVRIIILNTEDVFGIEYSKKIDTESIEPLLSILTKETL